MLALLKRNLVILLLILSLSAATIAADKATLADRTAELNQLNQSIQALQQTLAKDRDAQQQLHQKLEITQQSVSQINQRLNTINQQLAQQQNTLQIISSHQEHYQQTLQRQMEHLAEQLRAAYVLSRYEYWQVLASQENPAEISRSLSYYQYLNQARSEYMAQLNLQLHQLEEKRAGMLVQQQQAKKLLQQQQQDQIKLIFMEQRHKQLLDQLSQKIQNNNQLLAQRLANKRALEAVLQKLQTVPSTVFQYNGVAFNKLQGRLPWPTSGKVVKRFGTDIGGSDLRYTGILIAAPAGQAVQAIYPGKVVFADRLQGFGLMLILDHGNGFMTLYAHNQTLNQKLGSTVNAGDVLSSIGNSGSTGEQPGLYFEIRQRGKPVDPSAWLKRG